MIIFLLLLPFLLMIRNGWVSSKHRLWNQSVFEYRRSLIEKDLDLFLSKPSYQEMYDSVLSYNEMIIRFWCFNLDKLVKNRSLYEEIKNMEGIYEHND